MDDKLRSFLLWISVPLCVTLAATGLQVFWPAVYARETQTSLAGAWASDILDLCLVLPVLIVATVLARCGSLRALFVWAGVLGFLTYNFVIYVFAVHFNPMFLVYCAVLGLSFYGLVGLREYVATEQVSGVRISGALRLLISFTFLFIALSAAFGEIKEIVTAVRAGQVPASIEPGQLINPIHALDLCFLLPIVAVAGVRLLQKKATGFVLAPTLMVTLLLISVEVLTIVAVAAGRGMAIGAGPIVSFGGAGVVLTILLVWYMRAFGGSVQSAEVPRAMVSRA